MGLKIDRKNKFGNLLIALGLVGVLGFGGAAAYEEISKQADAPKPTTEDINTPENVDTVEETNVEEATTEVAEEYVPAYNFDELKQLNPQTDGILVGDCINGGVLPVVKPNPGDYETYANTAFAPEADQEYLNELLGTNYTAENTNQSGTIFLDPVNQSEFEDDFTILYGHNNLGNQMFGGITNYKDQEYANQNPTMKYYTQNGEYNLDYVCINVKNAKNLPDYNDYGSEEAFAEAMQEFQDEAITKSGIEIEPGDKVVGLMSCTTVNPEVTKQSPDRLIAFFKVSKVNTLDMNNDITIDENGVTIADGQDFSGYQDYTVSNTRGGR